MNNNYEAEYEVDLIQALWEILLRWKPMVLIGILTAILVSGYMFLLSDEDAVQVATLPEENYEEQIEYLKETLSEDDVNEVEDLVYRVQALSDLREYSHNAAIMRINPNKAKELVISYQLNAESKVDRAKLVHQYNNAIQSEELANRLNGIVSLNGEDVYISDLINVDTDSSQSLYSLVSSTLASKSTATTTTDALTTSTVLNEMEANYLCVQMLVLDEWDEEELSKAVQEYVDALNSDGQLTFCDSVVRQVHSNLADSRQTTVRSRISSEKAQILSSIISLNGYSAKDENGENPNLHTGQAKLFFLELKQQGLNRFGKKDASPAEATAENAAKISANFSKKNAMIGFFIGIIAFAGTLILYRIFNLKTGRVMGKGSLDALPMMALVSGKEKKNAFWISPFVKKLRDKNRENRETTLKNATSSIEFFRNNVGEEKVSLVTIGTVKDATNQVLDELKKEYTVETQKDLSVVSLPSEKEKQEQLYKELEKLSGAVVVVTEYDITPLRILERMVRLMSEKDIKIIGSLGVE